MAPGAVRLMHAGNTLTLRCVDCGWATFRVYDEERGGFGRCNKCGGDVRRNVHLRDLKRIERAKRELEGGPTR